MEIIIIPILILVIAILGYAVFNLLRKVEKLEQLLVNQNSLITTISTAIELSDQRLKQIDAKGIFEADDEIGWFFKSIKEIQSELNTLK